CTVVTAELEFSAKAIVAVARPPLLSITGALSFTSLTAIVNDWLAVGDTLLAWTVIERLRLAAPSASASMRAAVVTMPVFKPIANLPPSLFVRVYVMVPVPVELAVMPTVLPIMEFSATVLAAPLVSVGVVTLLTPAAQLTAF